MKKKTRTKARKGILQGCELIPITDPAEIAALERRIKKAEKALALAQLAEAKAKLARLK
jgi:hypothetical protein